MASGIVLTGVQERYIVCAAELQRGRQRGIYFSLWTPGKTQTGRALLKRGVIVPCGAGPEWPFCLSDFGWHIYMNIPVQRRTELLFPTGDKR